MEDKWSLDQQKQIPAAFVLAVTRHHASLEAKATNPRSVPGQDLPCTPLAFATFPRLAPTHPDPFNSALITPALLCPFRESRLFLRAWAVKLGPSQLWEVVHGELSAGWGEGVGLA